jgi:4-amino-4-deoxy-L-arabinose transferase-like glycosyltransferase
MRHWFLLVAIAAAILYALSLEPALDLNGDSPRFVMLARSIHDGQGYWGRFATFDQPETQIPYLYPLMLTAAVTAFGPDSYL